MYAISRDTGDAYSPCRAAPVRYSTCHTRRATNPCFNFRDVINALLSFVELPTPDTTRGQKRSFDETGNHEPELVIPPHSDILASFDDWFSGAQFDSAQTTTPSVNGPAAANMNSQWNDIFQTNDFGPSGPFDPTGLAPSGSQPPWPAFTGVDATPVNNWSLANSDPAMAHDRLTHVFGNSHVPQGDQYAYAPGFDSYVPSKAHTLHENVFILVFSF